MNLTPRHAPSASHGPLFRVFVIAIVVLVAWVPGAVALAMLLSGKAG